MRSWPSNSLPPLARLQETPTSAIVQSIAKLRRLYSPQIVASTSSSFSEYHDPTDPEYHEQEGGEAWELLRRDEFERTFSIRWLTSFIARSQGWLDQVQDPSERESILQDAASLLASCSGGPMASGSPLKRQFIFNSSPPIRIQLQDIPLSSEDHQHTGVGLQTWGSSCILAERMMQQPLRFGLSTASLRILEIGAGTGLLSIMVTKLLSASTIGHLVVATDFHPSVLANLTTNLQWNHPSQGPVTLESHLLDWKCPNTSDPPFDRPFDIIFGADVVYETTHPSLIKNVVERFLRKPSGSDLGGYFHLIIPLRPTHQAETDAVSQVLPTREQLIARDDKTSFELAILEEEQISRSAGSGGEVEYRLWKLGWV